MHSLATSQSRCELALRFGLRVRVRVARLACEDVKTTYALIFLLEFL